jgi:hypothetical protein
MVSVDIGMPDGILTNRNIVIRQEYGNVIMIVGDKRVELTTSSAHKLGMGIAKKIPYLVKNEIIFIMINGERVELPGVADKVAGALLRKADDADDFQIKGAVS